VAGWLLFQNCLPGEVYTASPRIEYWSCLRAASPFLLTQLIYVATEKSSMLILGMTAALREVGIFALSSSLAMLLALPLTTANTIISGRVAHLHKCGQKAELQRLFGSAVRLCLLVTAPLALLQIIWGDKILGLLGDDFASGFLTLRILAFGQIFNVAAGSVGVALNMSGHTQETVRGTAYSSVLGLLLCALLIPRFGAPGAALAQSIAVIAFNVFLTVKVRQKLDLDPSILAGLRRQVA
jgi:O-antigen/teichoic acid export membrane protein